MNTAKIKQLHDAYVGQSYSGMGSSFRDVINFIGYPTGHITTNLTIHHLEVLGLNKREFHVFNLKFKNVTAIAMYEPLERVNQVNAHKITFLAFYDVDDSIYGGEDAYRQRLKALQTEFHKNYFRQQSGLFEAMTIKAPPKQLNLV